MKPKQRKKNEQTQKIKEIFLVSLFEYLDPDAFKDNFILRFSIIWPNKNLLLFICLTGRDQLRRAGSIN